MRLLSRVLNILGSTIRSQAGRFDLALLRAGFVLAVVLVVLLPLHQLQVPTSTTGPSPLIGLFYGLSVILLMFLAGRLSRDAVGDATSGHLSLIYLTGTTQWEWTLLRVFEIWIGFLSVWVVRLPFLLLFFSLGGLRVADLVIYELSILLLFPAASAGAMLASHRADDRKSLNGTGLAAIIVIEGLLLSGRIVSTVAALVGIGLPAPVVAVAHRLSDLSVALHLKNMLSGGGGDPTVLWAAVPYFGFTAYWLRKYVGQLYERVGESPQPIVESKQDRKTKTALERRTPLPRCWDNALAWHSYVYYAGGYENTIGRTALYGLAFLLLCVSVAVGGILQIVTVVVLGASLVSLINVMNHTARCLDKEVKAKTLSSLVLTPNNGSDVYRGWQQGTLWLAIPDFVYALLAAVVLCFAHPVATLVTLSIAAALSVSGPLLMISYLVPVSLRGLGAGAVVVLGLFMTVSIGLAAGYAIHPAAFPFAAIPIYWLFNRILLATFVEKWMRIRIDREA